MDCLFWKDSWRLILVYFKFVFRLVINDVIDLFKLNPIKIFKENSKPSYWLYFVRCSFFETSVMMCLSWPCWIIKFLIHLLFRLFLDRDRECLYATTFSHPGIYRIPNSQMANQIIHLSSLGSGDFLFKKQARGLWSE